MVFSRKIKLLIFLFVADRFLECNVTLNAVSTCQKVVFSKLFRLDSLFSVSILTLLLVTVDSGAWFVFTPRLRHLAFLLVLVVLPTTVMSMECLENYSASVNALFRSIFCLT